MNNRIAEIKARLEKTTPGPWKVTYNEDLEWPKVYSEHRLICAYTNEMNAYFIAHAPEDIQYLLEITDILREVCKIALEDLENTFPDDAELPDIDTRESIRVLRRALKYEQISVGKWLQRESFIIQKKFKETNSDTLRLL